MGCRDSNATERLRIGKVGACGLQTYQLTNKLKWAIALEYTTIKPILYIQCGAGVSTNLWKGFVQIDHT